MALDTQKFGITRHWLSAALQLLTSEADIFTSARMRHARKAFLAGKNQLDAIKNWLANAGVIETGRGRAEVTEMGRLMAAKDDRAKRRGLGGYFTCTCAVTSNPARTPLSSQGRTRTAMDG